MSASSRPKRTATKKAILIQDSSDSESESDVKPETKKKIKKKDLDDSFHISKEKTSPKRTRKTATKTTKTNTKPTIKTENNSKSVTKRKPRQVKNEDISPSKKRKIKNENETDTPDGGCISTNNRKTNILPTNSKSRTAFPNPNSMQNKKYNSPWTEPQLLSELQNVSQQIASNIINLFNDDNTIPFICRYRKELIGEMEPDKLRDIKISYNHILNIKSRAETIVKHLEKENLLTSEIRYDLACAKSLDELDHLYAPYKPTSKASLAERAKSLGLQVPAEGILFGTLPENDLSKFINTSVDGLETMDKVFDGIKHIISHIISKDAKVLDEIRRLQKTYQLTLQSKVCNTKLDKDIASKKKTKIEVKSETHSKIVDPLKFEMYFDYKNRIDYVKPHQILAINRGESQKVLSVKVIVPDIIKNHLLNYVKKEYLNVGHTYHTRTDIFLSSFNEAYNKKLIPLITRQTRSELTKLAEKASVDVFASNLKQLLLMSPVKGEKILGIDPGFSNGCKLALISECGHVLDTAVIYPHTQSDNSLHYGKLIAKILSKHNCKLIALGNGTACRETEKWISDLFAERILNSKTVRYSIVTEQGASIYSCGEIAKKEFPELNVNLISAVSIARRLNDPLGEFVKIEPKHLGVGMYQHDINEKILSESLNEVVTECVSFVGVDINTASVTLLRHLSGLTAVRAENIVKYRKDNGPFKSREELKKVKQIGEKTFIQCAGFVRIEPLTAGITDYNVLDSTWIHPESYDLAKEILKKCSLTVPQVGSKYAIEKIKDYVTRIDVEKLSIEFKSPVERIKSVLDALQRELLRDYRSDFDKKPMFKQGLTKMSDLEQGTCVTGAITNITHFGYFVDIGVEQDGLIHVSKLGGMNPSIGDRVEATVISVDIGRRRIQLRLQGIL